ncbi:hypothetical protein [Butyrivibrio sp. INlla21]|uniref:hypothetical protein n=1 Tax=Butyrivibrio sp. INlla21 TaxID=1520811 RepID=UPI0008EF053A|nr:hypothetical protein [Butyrivibrio sp. INlla21]SFU53732.1 hypothetical protein SAMN02910342_00831 [Butyrivibrio sp. INlla21]
MSEKKFDPMTGQPIDQGTGDVNQANQPVNQPVGNANQGTQPQQGQVQNPNPTPAPNNFQQQFGNVGQPAANPGQQGAFQQQGPFQQANFRQQGNFQQQGNFRQGNFQQGNFGQHGNYQQNQFGGAQPFGGNNIPPQGNDKKKLFIIGGIVAAVLIVFTLVNAAMFMGRNKSDKDVAVAEASEEATVATPVSTQEEEESADEASTQATEVAEEKEEKEEQASVPHAEADPNGLTSFTLNGKTYQLPVRIQELIDDGWQYNKDSDAKILLGSGDREIIYVLTPGTESRKLDVYVTNFSIDAKELGEGYVTSIQFNDFDVEKGGMDLSFHGGDVKFNDATKESIIAVYGEPSNEYDGSSFYDISYEEANDTDYMTTVEIKYNFDKETNKLSYVSLKNQEKPSDIGEEQVSGDEPEYLSQYKAPSSLGDDPLSGNISINGKVYNVPVPLKVLLEDGWSFGGDETHTVGANSGYALTLAKGDDRLYVSAYNVTTSACYIKYTIVTQITYYTSSINKLEVELPGGIKGSSTQSDVEAWLSSKGISNYEYDKSYGRYKIPIDQNRRNKIEIHVRDDGKMDSIEVQNYGWLME